MKNFYLVLIFFCFPLYSDINEDFLKAIGRGSLIQTKYLLEKGADLNLAEPKTGITPLHIAVKTGNYSIVEFLLSKGANPNAQDRQYGFTPVMLACHNGNLGILKLLLSYKGNINIKDKKNHFDALHIAAENGNLDILHFLLQNGANTESIDKNNKSFIDKLKENQKKYFKFLLYKLENQIPADCRFIHFELAQIHIGELDFSTHTQGFLFEKLYNNFTSKMEIFASCTQKYLDEFPDKYYWVIIFFFDEEYTSIKNTELAKIFLQKALIKNPNNSQTPSLLFLQGLIFWREKNKVEAKKYFRKAYELSEKFPGSIPALRIQEKVEIDKFLGNKLD